MLVFVHLMILATYFIFPLQAETMEATTDVLESMSLGSKTSGGAASKFKKKDKDKKKKKKF